MPKKRRNQGRNKNNRGHVKVLSALTAEDDALRTKPSRDSILRTSLMLHQRKILKNKELSTNMSFQSSILKCNTVFPAPFTLELSRSDQLRTEESELPHKESKEMHAGRPVKRKKNENDFERS
jgi:hypothetical protein